MPGTPEASQLSSELHGAAARGELQALFQPQLDLSSGRIVAGEALCRWQHPEHGAIAPDVFIPLAEENGAILEIGRWMIAEGCRYASEWAANGHAVDVAVNVSAAQLAAQDFFDFVERTIEESGTRARSITLEITESLQVADIGLVASRLAPLRSRGVGISIDDFGTGHSSVQQVINLPATEIKLDQTLVRGDHDLTVTMLGSVVELAAQRGLRTVAEGVETRQQLDLVRDLGFDRAQGYLIGQALDATEFERRLAGQSD